MSYSPLANPHRVFTNDGTFPVVILLLSILSNFIVIMSSKVRTSGCWVYCHIARGSGTMYEGKTKGISFSIISIALSQLCDLRVGAHLRLHGPELEVSCGHSSVTFLTHTTVTFPVFRPVPNYTSWWRGTLCVNCEQFSQSRYLTVERWESNLRPLDR